MSAPVELDPEWYRALGEVAEANGHHLTALKALSGDEWARLLAFVVAHMANQGYVPVTGWQDALAAAVGRAAAA